MPRCRVYEREDGHLLVIHPAPANRLPDETHDDFYARTMARAVDVQPDLTGLPYVDVDADDLPAREADCSDCDEVHPVRNQWSLKDGKIHIDAKVPNAHAEARHAEHAIDAELDKKNADPVRLARLQRAHRHLLAATTGKQRHEVAAVIKAARAPS